MQIYHFCVYGYSDVYREIAARFAREQGVRIVTVLSAKRKPPWYRPRSALAWRRHSRGTVEVADVNAASFRDTVPPGSHGIVTVFDQIFKPATIDAFESLVNFHPSVLPYYRGASPTQACFRNGETSSGFTVHRITERIDDGPILYQERCSLANLTSVGEIDGYLAERAGRTLWRYLLHLHTGAEFPRTVVDASTVYRRGTYMD